MHFSLIILWLALSLLAASQQIGDVWQTTWDRSKLFSSSPPPSPINFMTPAGSGDADIVIDDNTVYQSISGFGATLTESSALVLNNLKMKNPVNYWAIIRYMFNAVDGANAAGLNYIRVTVGASDFSASSYSLDDTPGDTTFEGFDITKIPFYVFSVLKDIKSINFLMKVHLVPWSPPAWMKDSGSMNGGSIQSQYVAAYPTYLMMAVKGFISQGISVYAISVQNEPQNSNPTYPSCTMTAAIQGQIGAGLRSLLNSNNFSSVKVIGYEHNWDNAGTYAVSLMQANGSSFDGVAFHCYAGSVTNQDSFHNAYPNKEIYFTECSGTIGSDWWSDVKWYMANLWIGSLYHYSRTGLMWNIALDGSGNPKLPGTNSCASGCRPLVTVNSDGSYNYNQEFYSMAHASKAIIPKDPNGPFAKRIGVSVGGTLSWALKVGAYVTDRVSNDNWSRYSIVVMNWYDNVSTSGSPVPVAATIEFRGMQVSYTFPVGVTTLWWYAPGASASKFSTDKTLLANLTSVPGINYDTNRSSNSFRFRPHNSQIEAKENATIPKNQSTARSALT